MTKYVETVTVHPSAEDAAALAWSPFSRAVAIHALVRREVRRLGGPGATAVTYEDDDGRVMREEAIPPGLLRGPYAA